MSERTSGPAEPAGERTGDQAALLMADYALPADAPEEELRAVTRVAATLCNVPTAVVNLLGSTYQHQVGAAGFEGSDTAIEDSMCYRALDRPELQYVPDASWELDFATNPWVDGSLADVKMYAAVPLRLSDGRVLGTLCVFSDRPGTLDRGQRDGLKDLATQVVSLFEQRRLLRQAQQTTAQLQASEEALRRAAEGSVDVVGVLGQNGLWEWISPSVERVLGFSREHELATDPGDRIHPEDQVHFAEALHRSFRLGETWSTALKMRDAHGVWQRLVMTFSPLQDDDGIIRRLHVVAREADEGAAEVA